MMPNNLKPPVWIARPAALQRLVTEIMQFSQVAVDTESNSLFAYRERVCLIQFSTPETDYLVDPLALHDLTPLASFFSDARIEKIFHAAEYDLICLKRDYGFEFMHIFDTMQAARILGRTHIGLADILTDEFNIDLEKRYQRANWGERPLNPAMLAYARLDTHYLIELRHRLGIELEEKGLLDLAREDFEHLTKVSIPNSNGTSTNCWRIAGKNKLSPHQMAILQALIEYRDQHARKADIPPFKILSNQVLVELAILSPGNLQELENCGLLSKRQLDRHTSGLLESIHKGIHSPPPHKPQNHRPSDDVLEKIELLKNWRKETGRIIKVESDVILPRELLEHIAFSNPNSPEELRSIMVTYPWRFAHFGEKILSITKGKADQ